MIDMAYQEKQFKNHIATFTDYGNIKIVDFKRPDSSEYRIRFLFEEDYCRLHISGDLGELIATNYNNMTFKGFSDFVNNVGYFKEKIDCNNRRIYTYDYENAKKSRGTPSNEYIDRLIEQHPVAFDMNMVVEQLKDYGKYKGVLHLEDDKCENLIPVSIAVKIVESAGIGGVLGYMEND